MRRPFALLLMALVLGLCGTLVRERPPAERLARAATRLQQKIDRASADLRTRVQAVLERDSLSMDGDHALGEGGLRLYRQGTVAAWNDHAPIADADLDSARQAHLRLPDGLYLHAFAAREGRSVHGVRRTWFEPPFENQYLQKHFDAGFTLPRGIIGRQVAGPGPVVRDAGGTVMLHLAWADGDPQPGTRSMASLLLVLGAVVAAVAALWLFAARVRNPWGGLLLFLAVLPGARYATLAHGSFGALATYPLFDPSLFASSFFIPSLGDLLINAAVLLCAAGFFHRAARAAAPPRRPWVAAIAALAVLLALAAAIGTVMVSLVYDGSVSLDLFRVQGFNGYSFAALLAIGLLLFAWLLAADALLRLIAPRLGGGQALLLLALAGAASIGAHHLLGRYDLVPILWPVPALWLLHRMRGAAGATIPALLLVAVLAFFTAHLLNRHTFKRMAMEREAIAETATTAEDPVIELLFDEARREMARNGPLMQWVRGGQPCNPADLDRLVRQPFFTGYWDRYDLRLHLIGRDGRSFCSTSPDAPASARAVTDRFEQGVPAGGLHDLRITGRPGEDALYMGRIALDSARLYLELRPQLVADGLGFPELLLSGQQAPPFNSGRFARARYERGILTASSGTFVFPVTWKREVPADGLHWTANGFDLLAQGDPQGTLVVLGTPVPSWWDHLTTFSYLFLFFTVLAALAGAGLLLRRGRSASLGVSGKVRLGVAGFAIASLLIFTFGLRRMVDARQERRSSRTVDERTRGVLAELRQTLRGEDALPPAMAPYLDHLLGNLSNVFFTDLSLYSPDGLLFATSREQVFNTGLLGRRMDPRAFHRLAVEGASSFLHREHIGSASFSTAYMPFRNEGGNVLAYLALPYFARQGEVDEQRAASYVALVNLFTLLFLLSVVAAALITHWTTRPLELLRRGLERIGLGARNEPILYSGNDELGQLVQVYNRKVEELRLSAEKLAQSERESAWKEMAKQVAHEIKNPLTPMKLNIQHFQHTWRPDAPDAKERLDRFSNGLVEQIDVLGRIAGEFSHFAQMPPAHPGRLDLSEVAATAVQLFANTPGCAVRLKADSPLPVHADREHLLRVFNNLIKNAQQAIPEGREGRVDVRLYRKGDEAVAEVRDNGTGIPADAINHVFVPKFTTKGSGMGLGLAMVKRMVENADGRVWFETEEGVGTGFFMALPLRS